MSRIGDNPNDKMPPGTPLGHDEVASDDGDEYLPKGGMVFNDDGLGPTNENENEPGVPLETRGN